MTIYDDLLNQFIEKLENETDVYLTRFLFTLEVNKIEALLQKEGSPVIFRKEVDEFGLILRVIVREPYNKIIINPSDNEYIFSNEEIDNLLAMIETEQGQRRLFLMLRLNIEETDALDKLPDDFLNAGPVILKEYDEFGLIKSGKATRELPVSLDILAETETGKVVNFANLK